MTKEIVVWERSRKHIIEWMKLVKDVVSVTMWPKGRNVVIWDTDPESTNDGVTVAQSVRSSDPKVNAGISIIKKAAEQTNKLAGDGTTTTTVLTYAIAKFGEKYIQSWVNPYEVTSWLKKWVNAMVSWLKDMSKPVDDSVSSVATISSQDKEVGEMISDIIETIWREASITVLETTEIGIKKEIVGGMKVYSWYVHPVFNTDIKKNRCIVENAAVIVCNKDISMIDEILPIMEQLAKKEIKNTVFIAPNIKGQALNFLVQNRLKGIINTVAISAPSYGEQQTEILRDVCVRVWAKLIGDWVNAYIKEADLSMVWFAEKVVVDEYETVIIGGKGNEESVKERLEYLKAKKQTDSVKNRASCLAGTVALIKVWAASEIERTSKKYKIEDAVHATKSALEEGVVEWWGVALVRLLEKLPELQWDEAIGVEILKKACKLPLDQIAKNAGHNGGHVVEEVLRSGKWFNAKTGEYWDLIEMWVIDPAKVVRVALENAVSAAGTFLTTEWLIVNENKKD